MARTTVYKQNTRFWIAMIDMITSILIIFLMVSFVDKILNQRNIELAVVKQKRDRFIQLMEAQFPGEIKDSTIRLTEKFDHLQIYFSDKILFETSEYELQDSGEEILAAFAGLLADSYLSGDSLVDIKKIQVEGHTDDQLLKSNHYPRNNWELSSARALEVVRFFIDEKRNLPNADFSANSFEATEPVNTSGDRSINRRIELKILFDERLQAD